MKDERAEVIEAAKAFMYTRHKPEPMDKWVSVNELQMHDAIAVEMADFAIEHERRAWVDMNERLPEESGGHLITDSEGFISVSYFQADKQRFLVLDLPLDEAAVIAWRPMPEPFTKEEK